MEQAAGSKINAQAASGATLAKLIVFTASLGFLPLSSYYFSLHYVWGGNATWAAITAIAAANSVLVAYIITSIYDDTSSSTPPKSISETKKDR